FPYTAHATTEIYTLSLHDALPIYEHDPHNLIEWMMLLSRGTHHFPKKTTAAIDAHPEGVGPYGLWDMCGNAWEFTRTAFFTGKRSEEHTSELQSRSDLVCRLLLEK